MTTKYYVLGFMVRRGFRQLCDCLNLHYTEYKSWLNSSFYVEGRDETIGVLDKYIEGVTKRT